MDNEVPDIGRRVVAPALAVRQSVDFPCPYGLCDDQGWIDDPASGVVRECECRAQRVTARRSAALAHKIPKRYQNLSFDRFPVPEIERAAKNQVGSLRRYCDAIGDSLDRGESIWIFGDKGTGKTTLSMLVCQKAIEAGRSVAMYTASDLLNAIRATYESDRPDATGQLVERLAAVDLLHIDDLAVPRTTEWALEQLYVIINHRYEDERSILVTSDVPMAPDEPPTDPRMSQRALDQLLRDYHREMRRCSDPVRYLEEVIGHRTVSRIVEMCGDDLMLGLFGKDNRMSRPASQAS